MVSQNSIDHKHSITQPCNKWRTCEPTKRKHEPIKCSTNSERCRLLNLVKLCNYLLISCVLLVCLINGSDASSFGCSSNPCIFGVCIDDLNSSYSCYCIDGYTGKQCQTNWDECWSSPCLNGGTCIDGVASYNCTCPEGFNGVNCEENLDECLSNPCQNGGTCDDRNNGYVCYCPLGYAGIHCEMDVAVCDTGSGNKCHNGGQCVEGRGLDFTCECAPGWKGRFCSIEIDECESSPCLNGGVCVDKVAAYACICSVGFTGANCEEDIEVCNDSPCKNSALCLMEEGQPVCYCVPDFHGEKCEYQYDECQIGPRCSNGGQCVDGVDDFSCACRNDFRGMFCECMQMPSGDLDCNYTDVRFRSTTPKTEVTDGMLLTSTALFSSKQPSDTEGASQTPTDMASVYTSTTITQSVPTTSFDGPFSTTTIEVLDLSKSTESSSSTFTTDIDTKTTQDSSKMSSTITDEVSPSTLSSTMETSSENTPSTSTETSSSSESSSSFSSILPTRPTIGKTTKLRPCPPDMTRPTTPSTTKVSESTTEKSESESTSTSTFPSEITSSSAASSDGVTQSTLAGELTSTTGMGDASTITSTTMISSTEESSADPVSSTEPSTSKKDDATSTSEMSENPIDITSLSTFAPETPTKSSETPTKPSEASTTPSEEPTKPSEASTSTTIDVEKTTETQSTSTTQKEDEVSSASEIPVGVITTESQPSSSSSTFKPPTTTSDEVFTLTPTDVANITETDCKNLKCYNGGSCVLTSEGPKCVCRFDRQDPNCRSLIRIKNAAFAGDSYLSHLIYSDNHRDFDIKPLDQILSINVELKARTRATDGLILLAIAQGPKGGHYTALFLHKGLLQFQFSCGLQTMLLSELEAPINTGHEFTVQVALDFSRNHSHCNASLRINDTLAMSGDQPTWLGSKTLGKSKTINSIWLHLGGSPQTPVVLMSELPGSQGFTGCLKNLKINEDPKEIFRDARDGFGITECGSLACLANPCRNGGTCEEKLFEHNDMENDINTGSYEGSDSFENRWKCKCPTGYLGASCERSVCENNPCHYGGTCVEFPGSGYLCLCPLGKHGHYCEHHLEIDQPSFSGSVNGLSSYISYPVPIPLESTLDLSFRITPTTASQISLLAFLGQSGTHDDKSDHLAVSFIQGYIMLTWNLGSGPRRIFTQKPLVFHDGEDEVISYHVQVIRQGRKASLYINGKLNVTGNSPGDVARLDVVPTLYIGGHSLTNFTTLPHDLPLHSGFQGCIYDLQLKSGSLVVPLHETKGIIGRSVGQCGTRECHRSACHNNGACLQHGATYTCICPDGWFGTLCTQKMNPCDTENNKCATGSTCVPLINGYECDCPIGKMGKFCELPVKYLSDVSLSGKRSYISLSWPNHTHVTFSKDRYRQPLRTHDVDVFGYDSSKLMARNIMEHQRKAQLFSMEFQLRPLSETGLLLFLGNVNDHEEGFISLSLKGGVIEFRIAGQQGQLSIVRSNRILAIGEWHKIRLSQNGRRLSLWVEGSSSSNLLQPNTIFYHNYNTPIYVGGLPDLSKLPYNSVPGFPIPFKGCVRQFYLNSHRYVLNEQTIVEARNIQDCDGTACGGDSCDLGGHCYLDDKSNPHCKCPETSKGVHCEIPESCEIIKCKNNGKCMPNGECSCPNGWGGYFCEIATNRFSLPSFNGKSYMIVPSQRLTYKDKRNGLSSQYNNRLKFLQISVNFSTINMDGLLLWNDKNNDYLGIGLENGFLKVVSNLLSLKDEIIDVPTGGYLTDGGWHNVKMEVDEKGQISLSVDEKLVYNEAHNSEKTGDLDQLGESFFLGGFPAPESISNRTLNHFHRPFSGCLQGIQISNFNGQSTQQVTQPAQYSSSLNNQDFSMFEGENIGECELYDEFVNNEISV